MRVSWFALVGIVAASLWSPLAVEAQDSGGSKIAIISIQNAILRSQEGQTMAKNLQQKFEPRQKELQQMQRDVEQLREQLQRGANTMSEDARRRLVRDIQNKERDIERASEDAQAEFNQEQQQAINQIGSKMMTVIDQYAKQKGYQIVLDISGPQSPVLYAVNEVNITNDIVELYDQQHPAGAASSSTGTAGSSATAAAGR